MESPCPSTGPNDAHPSPHSCIFQPTVRTSGSGTPPADSVGSPVGHWEGPGSAQHPNTTSGLIRRGSKLPSWWGTRAWPCHCPLPERHVVPPGPPQEASSTQEQMEPMLCFVQRKMFFRLRTKDSLERDLPWFSIQKTSHW